MARNIADTRSPCPLRHGGVSIPHRLINDFVDLTAGFTGH